MMILTSIHWPIVSLHHICWNSISVIDLTIVIRCCYGDLLIVGGVHVYTIPHTFPFHIWPILGEFVQAWWAPGGWCLPPFPLEVIWPGHNLIPGGATQWEAWESGESPPHTQVFQFDPVPPGCSCVGGSPHLTISPCHHLGFSDPSNRYSAPYPRPMPVRPYLTRWL